MKLNTHNDEKIEILNSHLIGTLNITYNELVCIFGQPRMLLSGDYKVDVEWRIQLDNFHTFTIYNWKNGKKYCGDSGLDVEDIKHWNIGGYRTSSCDILKEYIIQRRLKRTVEFKYVGSGITEIYTIENNKKTFCSEVFDAEELNSVLRSLYKHMESGLR